MTQLLEKLWELQGVLSSLHEKERLLHDKPADFVEIDREYQDATLEMAELEKKIAALGHDRRELDRELQGEQEVLAKYQSQLMQVKNQQQYAAALNEIEMARKKAKETEASLLGKMAEIEQLEGQLKALQDQHAPLKERFEQAYELWQSSLGTLRSEVDQIRKKAESIEEVLPLGYRKQFRQIMQQRQGIAVSVLDNNSCSICHFHVRSQAVQQLKRGEVVTCEGCRRFLYTQKSVAASQ